MFSVISDLKQRCREEKLKCRPGHQLHAYSLSFLGMSFGDYALILGQNHSQCCTREMQFRGQADKYIFKWQADDHKTLPFKEGANKELTEVRRKFKPCHPISPPTPADAPLRRTTADLF